MSEWVDELMGEWVDGCKRLKILVSRLINFKYVKILQKGILCKNFLKKPGKK